MRDGPCSRGTRPVSPRHRLFRARRRPALERCHRADDRGPPRSRGWAQGPGLEPGRAHPRRRLERSYRLAVERAVPPAPGHPPRPHRCHPTLAWRPDGKILATASADGSLRLWRADTGRKQATLYAIDGGKEWLTLTPASFFTASKHGADSVFVRAGGKLLPLGALPHRLERPNLVQRALSAPSVGGE